jgi:HD-GYP domain-containing protein (c-di-GMP phosphodiesterase class II)
MTNDRRYRQARPPSEALAEIERCAGTQFDPEIARAFIALARSLPAAA